MTAQHFSPNGAKFSPAIQGFYTEEQFKYKAQFVKCPLQSYKFKIYQQRTEISVIDNEFAKVVAYSSIKVVLKVVKRFTLISWNQLIGAFCLHMQLELQNMFWKREKSNKIETKSPPVYQLRCWGPWRKARKLKMSISTCRYIPKS